MQANHVKQWIVVAALSMAACDSGSSIADSATDGARDVAADHVEASTDVVDVPMPSDVVDVVHVVDVVDVVDVIDVVADATDASDVTTDASDGGDAGACTLAHVLVSLSDYSTFGGFIRADLATRAFASIPATDAGAGVDQDHANRTSGCIPFDLEHSGHGALAFLDPVTTLPPRATVTFAGIPDGDGGVTSDNPYDVAVITPHKAYVTQYNSDHLSIVDPTTMSITGSIDLHALADADGIPEMAPIAVVGHRAYVGLQLLDRAHFYAVPAHSTLAVINTDTDTLVDVDPVMAGTQGITLTCSNPVSSMPLDATGRYLLVAEPGDLYSVGDGCLDVIDTTTNAPARTITNATFHGDPSSVDVISGTEAWATVDGPTPEGGMAPHSVQSFDLGTGVVTAAPVATSTMYQYTNLRRAPDGHTVWAIGGDYNAGSIHVFDASLRAPIGTPHLTGMLNTVAIDFVP
jgi:hypothetical protein